MRAQLIAPPMPMRAQHTAPLTDFEPPAHVLPFDAPRGRRPVNHKTELLPVAPPRDAAPLRERPSRPVHQADPPPVRPGLWVAAALLVLAIDTLAVWLIVGRR
jgi:hypothetical protein